jgi:hypothetical protein
VVTPSNCRGRVTSEGRDMEAAILPMLVSSVRFRRRPRSRSSEMLPATLRPGWR